MWLVAVAWMYVVLMVAVVEATSPRGTVLGAFFTLLLYGVLPVAILGYLFLSPTRRRARRLREAEPIAGAHATPTEDDADAPDRPRP